MNECWLNALMQCSGLPEEVSQTEVSVATGQRPGIEHAEVVQRGADILCDRPFAKQCQAGQRQQDRMRMITLR